MKKTILFDRKSKDFGCFSNFSPFPINIRGKVWPTVEHYFQSRKFYDAGYQELIQLAPSPKMAKKMGNDRSRPIRPDWDETKEDFMWEALYAKFTQHEDLKKKLLSTGDAILCEHAPHDAYWGDCGDGSGKNRLGELMMQIRDEIKIL